MKILDATCGLREAWFNKHHPDVIYIDIRPEVKPDIVMNCTKTIFSNKCFDLIFFDPPHVPFKKGIKGAIPRKIGTFSLDEIKSLVKNAFIEFHRILKDDGFVIFKWSDRFLKRKEVLSLIKRFEPLFGQKTSIFKKYKSRTYWFCLKKL